MTVDLCRTHGIETELFTRESNQLPEGLRGRVHAAITAFHSSAVVGEFTRCIEEFRPHLVHANELFPMIPPAVLSTCRKRGISVVMGCDDYHLTCPVRTHFRDGHVCTQCLDHGEQSAIIHNCRGSRAESVVVAARTALLRRTAFYQRHVHSFVTGSEFSRNWLIEHAGLDADRVSVVSHPLESIPASAADPALGTYVGYAGRIVPEKGIKTLIKAAATIKVPLKLSRNEHHFCTVDIPEACEVIVTKNRTELAEFYRGARCLVVPSEWFETFGIVGAEAMSHGVPVIASRIGALANLIDDGKDGLLFEAGNANDLAAKIRRLWDDPDLCRKLGEAGREKVSKLTQENYFRVLQGIYQNTLGRS